MNEKLAISQLRKKLNRLYQTLYASERRRKDHVDLRRQREVNLLKKWAERIELNKGQLISLGRIISAHKKGLRIPQLNNQEYCKLREILKRERVRHAKSKTDSTTRD